MKINDKVTVYDRQRFARPFRARVLAINGDLALVMLSEDVNNRVKGDTIQVFMQQVVVDNYKEGFYWLSAPHEPEPTLVHGYYCSDADGQFVYGFNTHDGGSLVLASDLSADTTITPVTISASVSHMKLIVYDYQRLGPDGVLCETINVDGDCMEVKLLEDSDAILFPKGSIIYVHLKQVYMKVLVVS